jgi:hypothetical protein
VSYFRHPHTNQERRANEAVRTDSDEFSVKIRASRCGYNLPSDYDDMYPTSRLIRNWKNFRRARFRAERRYNK